MRRWIWMPVGVLLAAIVVSFVREQPATVGEKMLAEIERSHARCRSALLLFDYTPDENAVAQTMRETLERGTGAPSELELGAPSEPDRQWMKTATALFSWSPARPPTHLRNQIAAAHQRMTTDFARGPFDNAATDSAFTSALAHLNALTDETIFLAWLNADRGVLAALNDPTAAITQELLLLAAHDPGPILVFTCQKQQIYLIPEPASADLTWCNCQAYNAAGSLVWTGLLRLNGHPPADLVRATAVAMTRQALTPPPLHPSTLPSFFP